MHTINISIQHCTENGMSVLEVGDPSSAVIYGKATMKKRKRLEGKKDNCHLYTNHQN